jgi:hypothetical protein
MKRKGPRTLAERTRYRETSRHADVLRFVEDLRRLRPRMRVESMGRSALGQEMPVLVFGDRAPDRPVVLVIANIHAGEVEGKEAVLMLARDLPERAFERMTLLLVPDYNPDGNDRIDRANRALFLDRLEGQIGPEGGVGTRTTGEGINLNRDYMKLEAVESRNLSRLFGAWRPHLTVDCHTTDGSIHRLALTYDTSHIATGPCEYVRTTLLPEVTRRLQRRTGLETFFYGNFADERAPSKGWATYPALPRYGSHYRGLAGRMDILLEAYSYIPFRERVEVTLGILREIFAFAAGRAEEIVRLCVEADRARPDPVGIAYGEPQAWGDVDIPAWDLESQVARRIPGRKRVVYRVPHLARFLPARSVRRPYAYLLRNQEAAARKLRDHNIPVERVPGPATFPADAFVVDHVKSVPSPDVGTADRRETALAVRTRPRTLRAGPGDLLVRTDHPLGTLAVYLLEPESDDGLARWGYFDARPGAEMGVYRLPVPCGAVGYPLELPPDGAERIH